MGIVSMRWSSKEQPDFSSSRQATAGWSEWVVEFLER